MGLLPLGPEPSASAIPPYPHYAIIIVVLRDFVKLCNCFLFYQVESFFVCKRAGTAKVFMLNQINKRDSVFFVCVPRCICYIIF